MSNNVEAVKQALAEPDVLAALADKSGLETDAVLDALASGIIGGDAGDGLVLPDAAAGHGFVAIEAPLNVVDAYANLHVAEQRSMAAQAAGTLRELLVSLGRLRARPVAVLDEDYDGARVAVVAGTETPA